MSSIGRRSKEIERQMTLRSMGAKPVKTMRGTMFRLGKEALFTKKQLMAGSKRFKRQVAKKKIKPKNFGSW